MSLINSIKRLERKLPGTRKRSREKPVAPKKFVEHSDFMNAKGVLYPEVMKAFQELNSGEYSEALLVGGIGTGKTTLALHTIAYQLYLLTNMQDPHAEFRLDRASEIIFLFQSVNATLAETVDYRRFKEMITNAPYFRDFFRQNRTINQNLFSPTVLSFGRDVGFQPPRWGKIFMEALLMRSTS